MDVEAKVRTSADYYLVSMATARWATGSIGLSCISRANAYSAERLEGSPIAESRALLTA